MATEAEIEAAANIIYASERFAGPIHAARVLASAAFEAADRVCWQPIETAPKDGTRILVALKNPIPSTRDDMRPWDGLQFVARHPAVDRIDMGWNVAAPVGCGGFPDDWMAGWMPLPEPPKQGAA
jgi:hypothetical protein